MAVYAIGDIQGCCDELQRLLDYIAFDPAADTLWFTGDLVNRGPKSLETLRFVRGLGDRARCVLGNHDLHLLARHAGVRRRRNDQLDTVLNAEDSDELMAWLGEQPLIQHDAELGWTMVHAGLAPEWTIEDAQALADEISQAMRDNNGHEFLHGMYGDSPSRWRADLDGLDRLRFIVNCMTRMRYCTAKGKLDLSEKGPPGTQPDNLLPWFDVEGRRSADDKIVFGHWSTLGYVERNNAVALDTGCVWGGQLTTHRLDAPDERWSIPCPGAARPRS